DPVHGYRGIEGVVVRVLIRAHGARWWSAGVRGPRIASPAEALPSKAEHHVIVLGYEVVAHGGKESIAVAQDDGFHGFRTCTGEPLVGCGGTVGARMTRDHEALVWMLLEAPERDSEGGDAHGRPW